MKGGNDIKTEQVQEATKNVKVEGHTNRGNENEVTIRKTANFDSEIIHELGNVTWWDHSNESDQARVEEKEATYGGLTIGITYHGDTMETSTTYLSVETQLLILYGSRLCKEVQVNAG
jgi:hypothetical protein